MPVPKSTNWCVFILSCLVIPLVPLEKCYGSPLVDQHWENETTTTASSASDGWEGDSYESYEEVIDDSYYPDFPDPPPPTSRPSEPQKGEDHTNKKKSTRKRRTTNKNSLRTTERIPLMSLSRLPQRLQMMASDILFSIPNVFRIMNKVLFLAYPILCLVYPVVRFIPSLAIPSLTIPSLSIPALAVPALAL